MKGINAKASQSLIGKAVSLLMPYKKYIIFSFLLTICISSINMGIPILTQKLMDQGIMKVDMQIAIKIIAIMLVLTLFEQIISIVQSALHINLRNKVEFNLQKVAINKLLRMRISEFNDKSFSEILDSVMFDVGNIAQLADQSFFSLVMEIVKLVGGLVGLTFISWKLTLFILIFVPIKYFVIGALTNKKNNLFDKFVENVGKTGEWVGEIINGIQEIKLWNLYRQQEKAYGHLLESKMRLDKKVQVLEQINMGSDSFIEGMIINLIYLVSIIFIARHDLTVGGLVAFISYSNLVMQPITLLLQIKYQFSYVGPSMDNFSNFLAKEDEIGKDTGMALKESVPQVICFKNVGLRVNDHQVIAGVNLEVKKGEKVAFIGHNGSGKTSLTNLLLRFYQPTQGEILMDGIDIQKINIDEYRDLFAVMSQQTYLFNTSIRNNILMFREEADKELEKKCKEKNIDAFLRWAFNNEEGLDKKVGFKGSCLSGGEKQKVALIRTLLKEKSSILILDEATSSCDTDSEMLLNELLEKKISYPYIFVVTHRTEILKQMDKIVMLEQGHIIWTGNYASLIKQEELLKVLQDTEDQEEMMGNE